MDAGIRYKTSSRLNINQKATFEGIKRKEELNQALYPAYADLRDVSSKVLKGNM